MEPEQMLADARNAGGEGLGSLLELYRNYLLLLARTQVDLHLRGRVNPSDVVQETFLRACRSFGRFRGTTEQELIVWLRRILVNELARTVERQMGAQKRDVRREVSLQRRIAVLDQSSVVVDRRELAAVVADQLAELPEHYRDVIVLRNLEGLSFDVVAERMGRSTGAVRALWMRALDRLRKLTGQEDSA